ncbi:Uncharacterised protein [Candidatus Anstonella stagnisolia]|nr:Uncharacterised protein [Candidatus Anstonella stagnisolia]
MDSNEKRRLGKIVGVLGFLILTLNFIDMLAGWNKVADETAIAGAVLTIGGAYFALYG